MALPYPIVGVENDELQMIYSADGTLLQRKYLKDGVQISKTDYLRGKEYKSDIPESVHHEDGRVIKTGSSWLYEYWIKDHLENIRVTFSDDNSDGIPETKSINDYYSFGMEWNNRWELSDTISPVNKYRYNGKEYVEEMGWKNLDFGLRNMDPILGRMMQVDPLAGKYPGMLPFQYAGNNPINNIDIRGDSITPVGANQHLQMGIINWDRGVSAGNGYTLYGGTGTNSSGQSTQMWVARQDVGDGMHRDDWVMNTTDVKDFRENSGKYSALSNAINIFGNGGNSLWQGYKSTWTPENILIGATIIGGALKSLRGPVTNELYVRPNNATTNAQRASVQGKPCVDCGVNVARNNADHIYPLVREHYETGSINTTRMRRTDAVQPQCPTCSSQQGAQLSRFSKEMKQIIKNRTGG